ncbi:MAG: histidinol-phosphate transaminase, partial [Rhodoferax sp.]|nr:histidinol-phosphate transaminase [Pseudorhodobacter sp.]
MNDAIRPQPGILDIALYEGGKANVAGVANAVKLSSNENPFGPSDKAKDAFQRSMHSLNRYPNTDHASLRQAIGEVHDLDPARIICGAGSDEIITFLCQAYAGPKDEVVFTEHGFLMYRISSMAVGATPIEVTERERTADVDAILAACNRRTKLVFIANPNNPTGTMISPADMARLAAGILSQAILVIDGAYAEYVDGYDGGAALIESRDNVVMTRTFSKIYGLGGLRIGWGYGPADIINVLNRIRGPFNLSTAQLDAAEAAVRDRDHVNRCRSENTRLRHWLAEALAALGVPSDTSLANFVLARFA